MKHVRTHLPCLDTEWFSIIIVYNIGPKCMYISLYKLRKHRFV